MTNNKCILHDKTKEARGRLNDLLTSDSRNDKNFDKKLEDCIKNLAEDTENALKDKDVDLFNIGELMKKIEKSNKGKSND